LLLQFLRHLLVHFLYLLPALPHLSHHALLACGVIAGAYPVADLERHKRMPMVFDKEGFQPVGQSVLSNSMFNCCWDRSGSYHNR